MKTNYFFALLTVLFTGLSFNGCIFDPNENSDENIATPKPVLSPASYVPLDENARWVYATSTTNGSGAIISTSKFTAYISGKKSVNGKRYWVVENADGKNSSQLLHIADTVVYEFDEKDSFEKIFLNFGIIPGITWEIAREANTTVTGSFDGYETLEVSSGTFEKSARFTITTVTKYKYTKNGKRHQNLYREDTVVWYAPDVGLIKEVTVISENKNIINITVKELSNYNIAV